MTVAAFNYLTWVARYSEFAATVNADLANEYFAEACLFVDNSACSIVTDEPRRRLFLGMVTAHIAALNGPGSSTLVGRVNQASEGSVSVSTDYGTQAASAAFWLQTKYGAAFWQATAGYRTARYIPPPPSAASLGAGFYFSPYRQPGQW